MTTTIFKTIEIAGWLSDREVGKGKTAIWTGSEIQESCEINGPYWDDAEIQVQLQAAQTYADAKVAENNWVITPQAFVNEYNCEIDE